MGAPDDYLLCSTPAGDSLILERLSGSESLSTPFCFTLDLISVDKQIGFKKMLGEPAAVTIKLADKSERHLHGRITRFSQVGFDPRAVHYRAELRPWLYLLGMHSDNRIFQKKSVPEILDEVFGDLGFKDVKNSLKGSYAKREYCVQYGETTLDFVSRLMEDEGIHYFFEHTKDKHTLVLADDPDAHTPCKGAAEVKLSEHELEKEDRILMCAYEESVTSTGQALCDYNFEVPATDLFVKVDADKPERLLYDYPGIYADGGAGEGRAKIRVEGHEQAQKILSGQSSCRGFVTGGKFKMKGHSRTEFEKDYVLRSIQHSADRHIYRNRFTAHPADTVFRPPLRTRRPRIAGTQTAVVVGKAGEEIWTDKYGRIKVQFHWDRRGKKDENSSCWVRVAQGWAGKGYGAWFLPRIGQEVVISFLEGDPDRPLVTGSVYNAQQTLTYALPDNQTRSWVHTRSSKGGGGFNEIFLDDKKDEELINIVAQKDYKAHVLHERYQTIEKKDSFLCNDERIQEVQKTDKLKVKDTREIEITEGDHKLTVKKGKRTIDVEKGDEKHTVAGKRELEVKKAETHTNKDAFTQSVEKDYKLTIKGNLIISVDGEIKIESKKKFVIDSKDALEVAAAKDIKVKAGMNFKEEAGMNFEIKAGIGLKQEAVTVDLKASAMLKAEAGAMAAMKGAMVKIN